MGKKNRVKGKARTSLPAFVKRPFEGLPSECDVIALRELVPAGTAPLTLAGSDREVVLCSLLPMAAPAMVRESGAIWLGLQVQHHFGDPARDLGAVLEKAIAQAEAGEVGIVALGAIRQKPWVVDGEVRPRWVTTVSGSFDHRVVDGDQVSRFIADIAAVLEEPALLVE